MQGRGERTRRVQCLLQSSYKVCLAERSWKQLHPLLLVRGTAVQTQLTPLTTARIQGLSSTLIRRLENILAASLDNANSTPSSNEHKSPILTDTAVQQVQLDVESTALIRAAEEIMLLTRTMKEIWLFGGLDTIKHEGDNDDKDEKHREMEENARIVNEGFKVFLNNLDGGEGDGGTRKDNADQHAL